jgi:hypothetical protein
MTEISVSLRSCSRVLKLTALACCLAFTALISTSDPLHAIAGRFCYYYSDASHTQQVGSVTYDCCGHRTSTGTTSAYSVCGPVNCVRGCTLQ